MSANPEPETETNKWRVYEQRKRALPDDLSPAERDAEIRKIADELGI